MQYITEQADVERLLPTLMQKPAWGIDTETTGLDPHTDKVVLLQIGLPGEQYIIDTRKVSVEPLRPFLESTEIKKIGHNLKFDYKMIKGSFGIDLESLRDTYLGERILNVGRKFRGFGLDAVLEARLNVKMDKLLQKSFIGHQGDFSQAQLQYSADDVAYLLPLAQHMSQDIHRDGLGRTWVLENDFISSLGDMEFAGEILDVQQWTALLEENKKKADEIRKQLDQIAEPFWQTDLFGQVDINYGSPDQMVELFKRMRVKYKQMNYKTGEEIEVPVTKTDDKTLKKIHGNPFVKLLKTWRGLQIRINTFGMPFIKSIHPKTGRIHMDIDQLGTETGRLASGDSPVNPLNIPRENAFRHAFVAGEDEVVESDDFNGCELRIWAEISGDPLLTDAFLRGEDVHCRLASDIYRKPVTKKNENAYLRTPAKSLNFSIAYGSGPYSLYETLNGSGFPIGLKEAQDVYDTYVKLVSVGVGFLRKNGKIAAQQGYLVNLNGRRRYWIKPDPHNHEEYPNGKYDIQYKKRISSIERRGGNFLIQSVNADITKLAMTNIRRYYKKNKIRTNYVKQVYDEVVTRTHKDDSPDFRAAKLKFMQEAGEHWLKKIPMVVDGAVAPYWTKD